MKYKPCEILNVGGLPGPLIVLHDRTHPQAKLLKFLFKLKLLPEKYELVSLDNLHSTYLGPI